MCEYAYKMPLRIEFFTKPVYNNILEMDKNVSRNIMAHIRKINIYYGCL
jgi:hypothetical protein